jgi:cytochrome bd-type quinol oxidase subunit 2
MPAGVALAAALNGVFFFLRSTVARGTIDDPLATVAPWVGLALAAVLAGAITVVLTGLTRREVERTAAGPATEAAS